MSPLQPDRWPALHRSQQAFLGDLTGRRRRSAGEREGALRTPPRGTREDRWHVYTCGYVTRIAEAMGADFGAIHRVLGPEAFRALVERYLAEHPPRSHDLGHAGDRLPEFLEGDPLVLDLPFLPDLARLERCVVRAFVAEDAPILTWAGLRALPSGRVANTLLVLHPSVAVVRSPWPIVDLWNSRHLEDEAIDIAVENRPCVALVHRHGFRVVCETVPSELASILEALQGCTTILAELPLLAAPAAGEVAAVRGLVETFRALVEKGLFVQPRGPDRTGSAISESE
jgi:hypothetical protein